MNTTTLYPLKTYIKVFPEDRERLKKKKKQFEEQTIVANVSKDLTYYYTWFIKKKFGITLESPAFGGHVTIHNGKESIPNLEKHLPYLESLEGKLINVQYNPVIYLYWKFFAVEVFSEELNEIRKTLGLPPKSFHITIGKISDNNTFKVDPYTIRGKQVCVDICFPHS